MAAIASLTTREYSSGTCTLRITGQLSPLSQLTDKPVMVQSRFTLQLFPQPQLQPPAAASNSDASLSPRLELTGRAEQFSVLTNAVSRYVQSQLAFAEPTAQTSPSTVAGSVTLQPLGLTRHRLRLNIDRSLEQGDVELSALELADLADVLEQADSDLYFPAAADLPRQRSFRPKLSIWLGSTAAVGIAAILGSQWLPLQTPLTNLPPATREADIALEDSPELGTASPSPTSKLESGPAPEAPESTDEPGIATAEADPLANGPETSRQPVPSAGRSPSVGTAPTSAPLAAAPADDLSAPRATAPQAPVAAPAPQSQTTPSAPAGAPETAPSPAPPLRSANEPPYPAPSSAGEAGTGNIEAFSEPAPSPQSLHLPEAANNTEAAGIAPNQRSADDSAGAALPWQEQFRQQIQQGWTPIREQSAPLMYRLSIDRNGALRAIEPLSELSRQYQASIRWPPLGVPISQYPQGAASVLEIQFLPSGEVVVRPGTPSSNP